MTKYIDVSTYNGVVDFTKLDKSIAGVIAKVMNKSNVVDKQFENTYKNCDRFIGCYNYSYATTSAKARKDAEAVLNIINGREMPLGIWLDVEDSCQKGLGQTLIDIIKAYQTVIEAAGYSFGVYTGLSFYNVYIKKYYTQLKDIPFWIARYPDTKNHDIDWNPSNNYKPQIANSLYGWQYSSKILMDGIKGNVDVSIYYGEQNDCECFPKCDGRCKTLNAGLKSINVDNSKENRTLIAEANGCDDYTGTATQNNLMLEALKQGTLKMP